MREEQAVPAFAKPDSGYDVFKSLCEEVVILRQEGRS